MSHTAPLANLSAFFALISSLPFASATFSVARCCTLAVRTEFQKYYDKYYPWDVCNLNKEIDFSTNETFPSIVKPMSWAKEFCRGTQYSNLRQWLGPLATYISPYIGLLLLCPIGEENTANNILPHVPKVAMEYLSILGDPASAVFGAAAEIYADTAALYNISSLPSNQQSARWVAALAGALKFSSETNWRSTQVADSDDASSPNAKQDTITQTPKNPTISNTITTTGDSSGTETETTRAITLCIAARTPFASAILIPVVLMLAVTAATFYDAYSKKGDKDTGLALAYCVWYSWILVPAVAGNCFATALSPDVARRAFSNVMDFAKGQEVVVALRDRHVNNRFWGNWLDRQEGKGKEFETFLEDVGKDVSKTAQAVENANSYWISTAYVVFSFMTLVCLLAVVFRQIISRRMDEWMQVEDEKQ
ncbi:hypothetical protein OQA88_2688 [Cercophora sp. LCS_1]